MDDNLRVFPKLCHRPLHAGDPIFFFCFLNRWITRTSLLARPDDDDLGRKTVLPMDHQAAIFLSPVSAVIPAFRGGAERAAINAPIQGSAADIIRRAMVRLPGALDEAGLKARMLLQVHDELIFEAPDKDVNKAAKLIAQVMEKASLPAVEISVPLVVEARAADNWDAAH